MKRVFFITSNQLKVFEWNNKVLSNSYSFRSSEEGIRDFEDYMAETSAFVSYVLLELLEEEFHREKIPHVHGKDRRELVRRASVKHYRDSKYVFSKWLEREADGRRDDDFLLTSVSNPEPVDLWMEEFEKYDVPIAGIWSLPMLSEELLKKLPEKAENILLVSRQMRSTLRESYFRKGKLFISRQVKVDPEIRSQRTALAYISEGVEQIHRFLSNQRYIGFGSKLDIYCLVPEDLYEEGVASFEDSDILNYHFFNLDELFNSYGIKSDWEIEADTLFAYMCSTKKKGQDHYLPKERQASYFRYVADQAIFYVTTLGSLALLTIAGLLFVNGMEIKNSTKVADQTIQRLEALYEEDYSHEEKKVEYAYLVKESVKFSERLRNEASVSPEKFLIPLSNVYSDPKLSMITLTSMKWEKIRSVELDNLRRSLWEKTSPQTDEYAEYEYNEDELDDQIPVVTLTGEVSWESLGYSRTVLLMENFVTRLQSISDVDQLLVEKTPVDIRINSRFRDQTGADFKLRVKSDDASTYKIMLLLKPSEANSLDEVADNG